MKYYYFDLCANDGENPLSEYKDFDDFKDGLLWNREIAKEYGDSVISMKELRPLLDKNKEFYVELNGAGFIACENIDDYI